MKRGGHVRITAQFMFLPTRWRLVFRAVGDIIWIGFSLYVAWIGLACIEEGLYYPEVSPIPRRCEGVGGMHYPVRFVLVSWRIVEEYVVRWRNGTPRRTGSLRGGSLMTPLAIALIVLVAMFLLGLPIFMSLIISSVVAILAGGDILPCRSSTTRFLTA